MSKRFSAWEITVMLATIISATVSITVFALSNFDEKGAAEKVEINLRQQVAAEHELSEKRLDRLDAKTDRIEDLLTRLLLASNVPVPPKKN